MKSIYLFISSLFSVIVQAQIGTIAPAPTGNSQEVGYTQGELSVSLSGSATYAIPILAPPGVNGVIPQVSLVYDSFGNNGLAGYGWNLNGLSSISRIPSTKYHNNSNKPVNFNNDQYSLNGERLLLKDGYTYSQDGAEFQTENYSTVKIVQHGVSPYGATYGPEYFTVEYPDGSKAYYGQTAASRSRMEWAITYWINPQGLTINYSYIASGGGLLISQITYGGTLGTESINTIGFLYTSRQRTERSYIGGYEFTTTQKLQEIRTSVSGIAYRCYVLGYDVTSLGYERLTSITEKTGFSGDDVKSLNPTLFTYENTEDIVTNSGAVSSAPISNVSMENHAAVSGDFDGDGKLDYLLFPTSSSQKNKYYMYSSSTNNNVTVNVGAFEDIIPVSFLTGSSSDGFKYFSRQGWAVIKREATQLNITVYNTLQQPGGPVLGAQSQYSRTVSYSLLGTGNIDRKFVAGDFNGDGLTDIVAVNKSTGNVYLIDINKQNASATVSTSAILGSIGSNEILSAGDLDGNGVAELWNVENNKIIIINIPSGILRYSKTGDSDINVSRPILFGDFNGDGKTDILTPKGTNTNQFVKFTATGSTSAAALDTMIKTTETYSANWPGVNNLTTYDGIVANDLDNDGKTDLVYYRTYYQDVADYSPDFMYGFIMASTLHNMGNDFVMGPTSISEITQEIYPLPLPIFLTSDTPNKSLEAAFITNNRVYSFQSKKNFSEERLLKRVTLGNGMNSAITYKSLSSCTSCDSPYTATPSQEFYPNFDIVDGTGFKVVSQIEQRDYNYTQKQTYGYLGAVANLEGRGLLGYRAIKKSNFFATEAERLTTVSTFDIPRHGVVKADFTVVGDPQLSITYWPTSYVTKTVIGYTDELLPNKVYKIRKGYLWEYNGLNGVSKETSFNYDIYNSEISRTQLYKNSNYEIEQTTTITSEYFNNPTGPLYYIGRLNKLSTSTTYGGATMTYEDAYTYNTNNLISQVKKKGHQTEYITEDNIYDSYGNITKKTITAGGISREANFEYTTDGRFLLKTIDAEGLTFLNAYNASKCLLTSQTDAYGLVTQYEYDDWGRESIVTDYLGKTTATTRSNLTYGQTLEMVTSQDGSAAITIFNDRGLELRKGIMKINGTFSYIQKSYDKFNRIISVSEPYSSTPSLYTVYQYDIYGRPVKETTPAGKVTNISYTGLTKTVSDGVNPVTMVTNSLEYVTSSTDNGGTVTYKYYPNGNLKESDFDGVKIVLEQDGWGRKTKITDPSAGVYQYQYNGFSQITKEITPKGTTDYTYTPQGKILYKTDTEGAFEATTSYAYYPDTKLLAQRDYYTSDGNAYSMFYQYDNYKRINYTEQTDMYATYANTYVFDEFGRVQKETIFASNGGYIGDDDVSATKAIRSTYKNGHLWKVSDDVSNQVLYEVSAVNDRQQITSATYGNGAVATVTYDNYGFPEHNTHDFQGTGATNIMVVHTTFDPVRANLTSRYTTFGSWTRTENFGYDDMDRLTQYADINGNPVEQLYDNRGRITENQLGQYAYNPEKPYQHANTELSPFAMQYFNDRKGVFYRDMETKGWNLTSSTTMMYDSSKSVKGDSSLKLTGTGAQTVRADGSVLISNTATTQYKISGWVYSEGPSTRIQLVTQTDAQIASNSWASYTVTNTLTGEWKYIELVVNVPASVRKLSAEVYRASTGNVWFDEIRIVKVNNVTAERILDIKYDMFKAPVHITETGIDKLSFLYNGAHTRASMFYGSLDNDMLLRPNRKFYNEDGTIEIKENIVTNTTEFIFYIGGSPYTAPVVFRKKGTVEDYLYLHRDYLGSILAITTQSGSIAERRYFDAWGNTMKMVTSSLFVPDGLTILDRGYTGHEHLQSVALINMNGRLYDPVLHRFLQPDNNIQEPFNTQNFNRYGYVLNNPLKYIDPSGESFWGWVKRNRDVIKAVTNVVVGVACVAAVIATGGAATPLVVGGIFAAGGVVTGAVGAYVDGKRGWDIALGALVGGAKGFIQGYLGAYLGGMTTQGAKGIWAYGTWGATTNVLVGGIGNIIDGRSPMEGWELNFGLGFVTYGLWGYIDARNANVNVWNGTPLPEKPQVSMSVPHDGYSYDLKVERVNPVADDPLTVVDDAVAAAHRGFTVNPSKYDYFFGRVVTGEQHNIMRSAQNLKDLNTLGIKSESQLLKVFDQAFESGTIISTQTNPYGTTIMRSVNIGNVGRIQVGFFYAGGNMTSSPSVSTIIPQIFK